MSLIWTGILILRELIASFPLRGEGSRHSFHQRLDICSQSTREFLLWLQVSCSAAFSISSASELKVQNSHKTPGGVDTGWVYWDKWDHLLVQYCKAAECVFMLLSVLRCNFAFACFHTLTLGSNTSSITVFYSEIRGSNRGSECNAGPKGPSGLFEAPAQRSSGQQSSPLVTRPKKDPEKGLETCWAVEMMSKPR